MEHEISVVYRKLQSNEIICENLIKSLRLYISKKYPNYENKKAAEIFADSINKIIDRNIQQFDNDIKIDLKKQLLLNSISKNNFKVTAADIFEVLVVLPIKIDNQINQLKEWLENVQDTEISSNELEDFLYKIKDIEVTNDISFETILAKVYENKQINIEDKGQDNTEYTVQITANDSLQKKKSINYIAYIKGLMAVCIVLSISIGILLAVVITNQNETNNETAYNNTKNNITNGSDANIQNVINNGLEKEFVYKNVNIKKLRRFLSNKHSILVRKPYFATIINIAKEYDVNPLLILAIAGQEQGFVPEDNKYALKIANNPFNLYGSWMNYNTDIKSACEIVSRTIINLNKGKPKGYDTIKWINRKYAEDKTWHKGVKSIFLELKEATN